MQGDAWTTDRFPTRNYGTDSVLRVNSTPVKRAFLRFEVTGPAGTVQQAVLRVFAQSGAPQGFRVYAVSPAWTEGGITHGSAPALGALVATVAPFTTTNSWRTIDVTGAVPAVGAVGFAIVEPGAQSDIVFASKETAQGAQLEVVVQTGDPPVNTVPPGIAGTLRVGETLTVVPGAWTGTEPIALAYQWQRCGPAGGGCADVPGAVGTSYLLGEVDFDRTIRVREIATNVAATFSVTSAATARIAAALQPPVSTTLPAVTGTPLLGGTLTVVPGTWTGTQPITVSYQWERCDAGGQACSDVPGATAASYLLGTDDLGLTLRFREAAVNEAGSASARSPAAGPVLDPGDPPLPLTLPTIAGTPRVGETLTAGPGTWTGSQPMAFAFQWQLCGPVGGGCDDIAGETGTTYLLEPEDFGRTIRVREIATNLAGTASASSDATPQIAQAPQPPSSVAPPTVTGTPHLGRTLTAVPGTWSGPGPIVLDYAWQRCDAQGCADVPGATGTTYVLSEPDVGATVRVREAATNDVGSASALSAETAVVIDPGDSPVPLSPPTISGTARIDETLTAAPGTWSGTPPIAFSFQWLLCGPVGGGCDPIPGETGSTYLLGALDVDHTIRVRETGANLAGTASADSDATSVVLGIPVPPPPPPPSGECSRADATGCAAVAGSRISLLNQKFTCNRPLADIAVQNPIGAGPGRLPLLVEVGFTTFVDLNPAVIDLRQDCVGDGDDETIDLVLAVEGDGRTIGGTVDAIKVRLTAREIQVTGYANCGPHGAGTNGIPENGYGDDAHQDGAQIQGGDTVEFIDFEWGDWETNTATCQGAAGIFLPASVNAYPVVNMACIRCKSVSCNHGMHLGVSTGSLVVDSMWRTGNPDDRTVALANGQTGLCNFASPACTIAPGEPVDFVILNNDCDRWPYGDGT